MSGGLEGRCEAGVEDGGHRYRQHRVGKDVDGLRVLVDGRRTGLSSPAGQGQNHQDAQLLSQDRPYSGSAQAQRPPGLRAAQPQSGAQSQSQPVDRPQQGQAERRYSESGAPAEDLQGGAGGRVVAVGQRPVEAVGRHDDEAGEHRGQRRPGEAVVGLKDTGEDHRHPVHGHLEGEHAQKGGDELVLEHGVDPLGGGEEGGDGGGEDDED